MSFFFFFLTDMLFVDYIIKQGLRFPNIFSFPYVFINDMNNCDIYLYIRYAANFNLFDITLKM